MYRPTKTCKRIPKAILKPLCCGKETRVMVGMMRASGRRIWWSEEGFKP
jgi:hypothetical protein